VDEIKRVGAFLLPAVLIAMIGSLVRYLRFHRHEVFSWGAFITGQITSAFIAVVVGCFCLGAGLNQLTSLAIAGALAYTGGRFLDVVQEALFKWFVRWFERRSK